MKIIATVYKSSVTYIYKWKANSGNAIECELLQIYSSNSLWVVLITASLKL